MVSLSEVRSCPRTKAAKGLSTIARTRAYDGKVTRVLSAVSATAATERMTRASTVRSAARGQTGRWRRGR